jgi:hypothetical protein
MSERKNMTYGVPYSFVPGTKAKADEVNANFIEILNKIETTNSRIDETNSQLDETNSNLNETKTQLSEAEDKISDSEESITNQNTSIEELKEQLDGEWTADKLKLISSSSTISSKAQIEYSLSDYFPDNENVYEVIGNILCAKSSVACELGVGSSIMPTINRVCVTSTSGAVAASFMLPIGTDRVISLNNMTSNSCSCSYFIIFAYRKVR